MPNSFVAPPTVGSPHRCGVTVDIWLPAPPAESLPRVLVQIFSTGKVSPLCEGSLVSPQWALVLASCVESGAAAPSYLQAGVHEEPALDGRDPPSSEVHGSNAAAPPGPKVA